MKEHATEFAGEGGVVDDEVEEDRGKPDQPTEAEAYAAQQRKDKQDKDRTVFQRALDMVMGGFGMVGSGLKTAGDAINDMPGGKEAVLGGIIALLVISNIWTYYAVKPGEGAELRRAKRLSGRGGMGEDEVAEALRLVLEGKTGGDPVVPREEAGELRRMLDEVERRATRLRELVDSAVGGEDLD